MIDKDDQENYARGRINKKTLQPIEKYIHVFDMAHLHKEWKINNINDRTFRCIDGSFFDDNVDIWNKGKLG
jgi:hypothetical protein